jgi:hypothetical protein
LGLADSGPSSKKVCVAEEIEGANMCSTHHHGEEVALEADALFIRVGKNQILGRLFLPCTILSGEYVAELLELRQERSFWIGKPSI